jgi:hypothetical protein
MGFLVNEIVLGTVVPVQVLSLRKGSKTKL